MFDRTSLVSLQLEAIECNREFSSQEELMSDRTLELDGVCIPRFLYGTAWKEEKTQRLTELALRQGFRGIDTANQRKHYHEAGVGQALISMSGRGGLARDDLFLQTKFTFRDGQDHRVPYDPETPIATQVVQSFDSSLEHLGVESIDSYVLHGPSLRSGLGPADWEAWRAMEEIQESGRARFLGVSNIALDQLDQLYQQARVKPRFVQNRCYAVQGWDRDIREFCRANGLIYQAFSLLTANRQVLGSPALKRIAEQHGRDVTQVVFRFALDVRMIPLTGTTNPEHMKADLDAFDFSLSPVQIEEIERMTYRTR
jgi:diketogulonate reductase-like aldo/keto reductase